MSKQNIKKKPRNLKLLIVAVLFGYLIAFSSPYLTTPIRLFRSAQNPCIRLIDFSSDTQKATDYVHGLPVGFYKTTEKNCERGEREWIIKNFMVDVAFWSVLVYLLIHIVRIKK